MSDAPALSSSTAEMTRILENTDSIWKQARKSLQSLQQMLHESGVVEQQISPDVKMEVGSEVRSRASTREDNLADPQPLRSRASTRRSSAFAAEPLTGVGDSCKELGGRIVTLETGSSLLGSLECVLVEPAGKQLARDEFVSAGLVVCLQSMLLEAEVLDEWCRAIHSIGWLDDGASVIIPNLQMSSALGPDDIEKVVNGALELAGFKSCLLVGKDWGAVRAVETATEGSVVDQITGIILFGPTSPPPLSCHKLDVPTLLVWAEDDDISPFEDHSCWLEVLDDHCVSFFCSSGAHKLDKIIENEGMDKEIRKFTTAAFLIEEVGNAEADDALDRKPSARFERLSVSLPAFLLNNPEQLMRPSEEDSEEGRKAAVAMSPAHRLALDLPQWISAGMVSSAE